MGAPKLSDSEFAELFTALGAEGMHAKTGGSLRQIYGRRRAVEAKLGIVLTPPHKPNLHPQNTEHPGWTNLSVQNGTVLIGSDAHLWPGSLTVAMRAFIHFIKKLKPSVVILNGDVMDFPRISRHAPIGWEKTPTVIQEIEAAQDVLLQIEKAAGHAQKLWTLGNHDARFATRLASIAPEYAKIKGVHLQDHFPGFEPSWAVAINDDVVVKHRHKGGIHSTHNSTLWAGKTTICGHLHSLKVTPFTDYNGTRFGVDCGCLADVTSRAFLDYTEASPLNWRSGFIVLTFVNGKLLWPEIVSVFSETQVEFRGSLVSV